MTDTKLVMIVGQSVNFFKTGNEKRKLVLILMLVVLCQTMKLIIVGRQARMVQIEKGFQARIVLVGWQASIYMVLVGCQAGMLLVGWQARMILDGRQVYIWYW
jgi:hypothetical protein